MALMNAIRYLSSMSRSVIFALLFTTAAVGAIILLKKYERERILKIKVQVMDIDSLAQIRPLTDSLVVPILYSKLPAFKDLSDKKTKEKFISALLPAILIARHEIENIKLRVARLRRSEEWTQKDSLFYSAVKENFNASDLDDLDRRLITLPNSIVLAQAAMETGWGQSRFFVEAHNIFGIWSFNETESRILAGKTRKNKKIYVRAYNDLSGSISDYFETLGRSSAYRGLRKARIETSDPFKLVPHLRNYSERRIWYTRQLKAIIVQNNLTRFDHFKIHPGYLIPE
jgi:Bax protein